MTVIDPNGLGPCGSVVVGVDQAAHAQKALFAAIDTARRFGVGCQVVWVYPVMTRRSHSTQTKMIELDPGEGGWLDCLLADTNPLGVDVTSRLRKDTPAKF